MTNGASYIMMTKIIRWCLDIRNPVFRELCPQLYLLPLTLSFIGAPLEAVQEVGQEVGQEAGVPRSRESAVTDQLRPSMGTSPQPPAQMEANQSKIRKEQKPCLEGC